MFKEILQTKFFTVEATLDDYDSDGPYYRIKSPDSVIICILTNCNNLLLVKQYRPNLSRFTSEFVAGSIEKNEIPHMAAKREVKEETGLDLNLLFLGKSKLLLNRYINDEYLYIGFVEEDKVDIKNEYNITLIDRNDLIEDVLSCKFEQLAALGLISIINLKFNINFLIDDDIYNKLKKI